MDITYPVAGWQFACSHDACAPQKLAIDGKTVFSFLHSRIDGASDDALIDVKSRLYHRGGCAVFEGNGDFMHGTTPVPFHQNSRIAANTLRMTTDILWPKATALKNGIELGSAVLGNGWCRYFTVDANTTAPAWHEMPDAQNSTVVISPLPTAIVFEREDGTRLEFGLGDDIWRWANGFNSESLKGSGKLEISCNGGRYTLRRWVTQCPPVPPAPKLPAKPVPGAYGKLPSTEPPQYIPDARPYRFNSYIAWSDSIIAPDHADFANLTALDCSGANGLDATALAACGAAPAIALDCNQLPVPKQNCRQAQKSACWCGRATQRLYRRIIRQLAENSKEGILRIDGMTPGWCDTASHVNRKKSAAHWDLNAILDTAIWTRQILGDGWKICIPQPGIWREMPSMQCLGAESGFRIKSQEIEEDFDDSDV